MSKIFTVGEVRKLVNEYLKEEITISRLTELLNEKAMREWIAVRAEGVKKLECPRCENIGYFENVKLKQ